MSNPRRILVMDRSRLAHNIYQTLLKPFNFSLFFCKTLREIKEKNVQHLKPQALLVNTNVFGKYFDRYLEWLSSDPWASGSPKIFLCDNNDAEMRELKKLQKSFLISKPFYPPALQKILEKIYE